MGDARASFNTIERHRRSIRLMSIEIAEQRGRDRRGRLSSPWYPPKSGIVEGEVREGRIELFLFERLGAFARELATRQSEG
jgi:hypothetical protein